jgi:hypothetical protein
MPAGLNHHPALGVQPSYPVNPTKYSEKEVDRARHQLGLTPDHPTTPTRQGDRHARHQLGLTPPTTRPPRPDKETAMRDTSWG